MRRAGRRHWHVLHDRNEHPARPIHPAQQKGSATTGGRERTADQWQQLLGQAGWLPTRMGQGMIEARPV
jgi:hypothetical protein